MTDRMTPAASAFFLPGEHGDRFCLFHAPSAAVELRGAFVYLHPFAEEMNCARHIVATQSRRLAEMGFGVLQIDLSGCGDSAGDFSDATWAMWQRDAADAADWLRLHCSSRISLWGLRLGAMLALDCAHRFDATPEHLMLWQPVVNGRQYLTQFLRVALAAQMRSAGSARYQDTNAMRAALASGQQLEIGGYGLNGTLAAEIDALAASDLALPRECVHWIECAASMDAMPAASQRLIDAWRTGGVTLDVDLINEVPFWTTPGHADAAMLAASTRRALDRAA